MMGDRAVGEGLKCYGASANTLCNSIGCHKCKTNKKINKSQQKKPTTKACHNNSENRFTPLYAIASSELTSSSLIKRLLLILTENKE